MPKQVTFTPHAPLLDRAACAITHGGIDATQKALVHGVPVCVVPFGRDQIEVARRVDIAGAGTLLPAKRLNPKRPSARASAATRH
jgi:UDP:flavonoid glycosyltransferase YjiC (YdhE family)